MPSLSIFNITQTSVNWNISGLSYLWDTDQYSNVYISINGSSSSPIYPPPSPGSSYQTGTGSYYGLVAGQNYTATGYVVSSSGTTYNIGSYSFSTLPPPRPNSWTWYTSKVQGQTMPNYNGKPAPCTAGEWNSFTSRINDFRSYKNLSVYSFTTASSGSPFSSFYISQVISAISAMSPPISVPNSSTTVTAYLLNGLRDSLNSIP